MRLLTFSAVVAVAVFSALNWRAQLQTQQQLDALNASLAERSNVPVPVASAPSPSPIAVPPAGAVPRELDHITLPPYIIESPDVLTIEVTVGDPKAGAADQLLAGQFQVRPDGTVKLALWGAVSVAGLTTDQAAETIRAHLAKHRPALFPTDKLTVMTKIHAANSKKYYLITDSDGSGEEVRSFSLTGSETVLDAVANVAGLPEKASQAKIWVARPRDNGLPSQVLPVEWKAITQDGITTTNYQLFPGDRIYVKAAAK